MLAPLMAKTVPSMLVLRWTQITVVETAPALWGNYPLVPIHSLGTTGFSGAGEEIVHVCGIVCSNSPQKGLAMEDGTGRLFA